MNKTRANERRQPKPRRGLTARPGSVDSDHDTASLGAGCHPRRINRVSAAAIVIALISTLLSSNPAAALNKPVVGIASTADGNGYWMVAADGGIFAYGSAGYRGSTGDMKLNADVVGMDATSDGYWLVSADGGVFTFGDVGFHGSMGGQPLNAAVVGIASTPTGNGYWLVGADGGVFAFGDAAFHGGMGGQPLNAAVVGIASTPTGNGYWLVGADGGVFAFGDAAFHGGMGGQPLNAAVVGIASTPTGNGYWLTAGDGAIFAFGDAGFYGSAVNVGPQPPEDTLRPKIVQVAQQELAKGFQERNSNNCNPYTAGGTCQAWCADFATWVWLRAGVSVPRISWTPALAQYMKQNGRWRQGPTSGPQPGDIVFYYMYSNRRIAHVGIVEEVAVGRISTIEGNYGDGVRRRSLFDPASGIHGGRVEGYGSPTLLEGDAEYSADAPPNPTTEQLEKPGPFDTSRITLKIATQTAKRVNVAGRVEPNRPGGTVALTLFRKKDGEYVLVRKGTAALTDRSRYSDSLALPSSAARCKVTSRFPGDKDVLPSRATVKFKC